MIDSHGSRDDVSMGYGPIIAAARLKGTSRKGGARATTAGKGGLAWFNSSSFAVGVACGIAIALAMVYAPAVVRDAASTVIAGEASTAEEPAPALTYEFIHRLPKEEVVTRLKGNEPLPDAETPGREYLLQAASFRSREDADTVRAKLMLEGMDVAVESVPRLSGGVWHRVLVGPFPTKRDMERTRTRLRELDFPAWAVERAPSG